MKSGKSSYIPDRGDIVWLVFNPQTGREHAGKRPALVISPKAYNAKVGLAVFCPITTKEKGYPFEVKIEIKGKVSGVILSDQIKSLDWVQRDATFISKAGIKILNQVIEKISLLISLS
ncbi:MAG: endoribonuclease MazF [Spirochaetes bacterium]|nr:endoribonuclease MazF [Spirochaetota bacterium]